MTGVWIARSFVDILALYFFAGIIPPAGIEPGDLALIVADHNPTNLSQTECLPILPNQETKNRMVEVEDLFYTEKKVCLLLFCFRFSFAFNTF